MSSFERKRVFEQFTNVNYITGQGGILVYSAKLQQVENAGVFGGVITSSGTLLMGVVKATGLATGSIGAQAPAPNGIQVYIQQPSGAEAPTGTIAGPLTLYEEGV